MHMFKPTHPQDILIFGFTFPIDIRMFEPTYTEDNHMFGPIFSLGFRIVSLYTFSVNVELMRISSLNSQFRREIKLLPLTVHVRQVRRFTGQI